MSSQLLLYSSSSYSHKPCWALFLLVVFLLLFQFAFLLSIYIMSCGSSFCRTAQNEALRYGPYVTRASSSDPREPLRDSKPSKNNIIPVPRIENRNNNRKAEHRKLFRQNRWNNINIPQLNRYNIQYTLIQNERTKEQIERRLSR